MSTAANIDTSGDDVYGAQLQRAQQRIGPIFLCQTDAESRQACIRLRRGGESQEFVALGATFDEAIENLLGMLASLDLI